MSTTPDDNIVFKLADSQRDIIRIEIIEDTYTTTVTGTIGPALPISRTWMTGNAEHYDRERTVSANMPRPETDAGLNEGGSYEFALSILVHKVRRLLLDENAMWKQAKKTNTYTERTRLDLVMMKDGSISVYDPNYTTQTASANDIEGAIV